MIQEYLNRLQREYEELTTNNERLIFLHDLANNIKGNRSFYNILAKLKESTPKGKFGESYIIDFAHFITPPSRLKLNEHPEVEKMDGQILVITCIIRYKSRLSDK